MQLNHVINKILNKGVFVDQPNWEKIGSLKEWNKKQNLKNYTEERDFNSKEDIYISELSKIDIKDFSEFIKKIIKDFKFLSKIQKWISFFIRSAKYYNSLILKENVILINAKNKQGQIIGIIEAKIKVNFYDEKYIYICWLAVSQEFRGKNIGIALLKKLEELTLKKEIDYIVSAVYRQNKSSIRAHEKYGSRILGGYYNFYFFVKGLKYEKRKIQEV